jgi:hypothetical protein
LPAKLLFQEIFGKLKQTFRPTIRNYGFQPNVLDAHEEPRQHGKSLEACPTCGMPLTSSVSQDEMQTHNPQTCRLVNLVLMEMGVVLEQQIRVEIYPAYGPLRGFYTTIDPYAIHISDEAYSQFPEYIIFHETKHLVDCLTKGWSEEGTPDEFARSLCTKYGYAWPPPHQHTNYSGL